MLGSVCHPDARVRRKAIDHLLECIDIMDATGSRDLKLWFADGTNYPGQDDIRARQDRLAEALADGLRPARRRTSGWSSSTSSSSRPSTRWTCPTGAPRYVHCLALGPKAKVVVDTGHHAPGTNIEFIVAVAPARRTSSAAFDFNSRFYADDDLMVGSADPFQLFRIMHEVVQAGALRPEVRRRVHARPVPQHRAQDPGPDPVGDERPGGDREGAARRRRTPSTAAQAAGDVLGANARPDGRLRHRRAAAPAPSCARASGLDPDPMAAYARSGYADDDRRRAGRRPAGRLGRMSHRGATADPVRRRRRCSTARNRLGCGPAQHELRRRQHLGQGHRASIR